MLPLSFGDLAAADGDAADGRLVVHRPGDLVDAVDGLLDQAVAAESRRSCTSCGSATRCRSCRRGGCSRAASALPDSCSRWRSRRRCRRSRRCGSDRRSAWIIVVVAPAEAGDEREILLLRHLRRSRARERTPGASTAIGFSQNTCLLAAMQRRRCCGRNPGGVASSTTSTPLSISFW